MSNFKQCFNVLLRYQFGAVLAIVEGTDKRAMVDGARANNGQVWYLKFVDPVMELFKNNGGYV